MSPAVVHVRSRVPSDRVAKFAGIRLLESDLSLVSRHGDVDVFKPDGSPLIMIRRQALEQEMADLAFPALHTAAVNYGSSNRGVYAGAGTRVHRVRVDGTQSKHTYSVDEHGKVLNVNSTTAGFMGRQGGRIPFCRATAFTAKDTEAWETIIPLATAVAALYAQTSPARFAKQKAACEQIKPYWRIAATPFTTLTINSNVLGAIHKDAGDFKEGLGCISCHRRGIYEGAILGFPEFGVGAELFDRDVIFFNPHEWHGVTDFTRTEEGHERISVVYYMRQDMVKCGTPEEELQHALSVQARAQP